MISNKNILIRIYRDNKKEILEVILVFKIFDAFYRFFYYF